MRVLPWLCAAAVAVAAVLTLALPSSGWSTAPVLAQVVGARTGSALVMLVVGAGLLACSLRRRTGGRHRAGRRQRRALAAALAGVLVVVAGAHVAAIGARGWSSGSVPTAGAEDPSQLTTLVLNVRRGGDAVDLGGLVDLVADTGTDVIALAESSQGFRTDLREALAVAGLDFALFDGSATGSPGYGSALLVLRTWGAYEVVHSEVAGVVRLRSTDAGPGLATAHPVSLPLLPLGPAAMTATRRWASELAHVRELAEEMPGGLVLGDLNATVDHAPLTDLPGHYLDAALTAGVGGSGTFPSWLPSPLGAAIDHVLLDAGAFEVAGLAVVDVAGTDHRGLVVRLTTV